MSERPVLESQFRAPHVNEHLAKYQSDTLDQVRAAVKEHAVVVVGMSLNTFVKAVRKDLTAAGIPFTYLEYGGYTSEWKKRLAIKMWSGWPTFPQVFVNGVLIGGAKETKDAIADGSLKERLAVSTSK
jgi:glutaredoxin-related protein